MGDSSVLWVREDVEPPKRLVDGLIDYKPYYFHSEPCLLYVSQGLGDYLTAKISFLFLDWEPESFHREDYALSKALSSKPGSFDEVQHWRASARMTCRSCTWISTDKARGRLFPEMTLSPCSGMMPFTPKEYDAEAGAMLDIVPFKAY